MAHYSTAEAERVRNRDMDTVHATLRQWAEQDRPEVETIVHRLREPSEEQETRR